MTRVIIPLAPKPFQRTGWSGETRTGKRYRVNPPAYTAYKEQLGWYLKPFAPQEMIVKEAVSVVLISVFKFPNNWSLKKREEMRASPRAVGADVDNLGKSMLDAMQGVRWFKNDYQVAHLESIKVWGDKSGMILDVEWPWNPHYKREIANLIKKI